MRSLALFLVALAFAAPAHAGPSVEQLVERAFRHPRSVAHTGTVRVTLSGPPRSTASVRVLCDGRGRERAKTGWPARGLPPTDGQNSWQRPPPSALGCLQTPPAASSGIASAASFAARARADRRPEAVIAIDPLRGTRARSSGSTATALVARR